MPLQLVTPLRKALTILEKEKHRIERQIMVVQAALEARREGKAGSRAPSQTSKGQEAPTECCSSSGCQPTDEGVLGKAEGGGGEEEGARGEVASSLGDASGGRPLGRYSERLEELPG